MNFLPSMVVMSVTLAHAILCGSLATRMIHRFVRGEKYLTIAAVCHPAGRAVLSGIPVTDGSPSDTKPQTWHSKIDERTRQGGPHRAPSGVPEVCDYTLFEGGPDLFAIDVFGCACTLLTGDGSWDREEFDQQPAIL